MKWTSSLKWLSTTLLVLAGTLISLKAPFFEYSFVLFAVGHIILIILLVKMKEYAMFASNVFFLMIDVFGIYNWILK